MLFGLMNAPASFQALVNDTLRPCLVRFACAYLDNIVVYSRTLQEHIRHVREMLRQLQAGNLYIQKKKCKFHKEVIKILGVVPPPQESVDNGPSLFDYGLDDLYNDFIGDFDLYLEYGEKYQNRTAFKDAFYR